MGINTSKSDYVHILPQMLFLLCHLESQFPAWLPGNGIQEPPLTYISSSSGHVRSELSFVLC